MNRRAARKRAHALTYAAIEGIMQGGVVSGAWAESLSDADCILVLAELDKMAQSHFNYSDIKAPSSLNVGSQP